MSGQRRPMIFAPLPVAAAVSIWDSRRNRPSGERLAGDLAVSREVGLPALIGSKRELEVGYCNRAIYVRRLLAVRDEWFPPAKVVAAGKTEEVADFLREVLAPIARNTRARWWCDVTDHQINSMYAPLTAVIEDYADVVSTSIDLALRPRAMASAPQLPARPGTRRPNTPVEWDDFVGQNDAKTMLQALIGQARDAGTKVPNVMLASDSKGDGKMALAVVFACEMRADLHFVGWFSSRSDVDTVVREICSGDVLLLVDVDLAYGNGTSDVAEAIRELLRMKDITIVATTSRPEALPGEVRSRLDQSLRLEPYSAEDMFLLARQHVLAILPPDELPSYALLIEMAVAAGGRPARLRAAIEQVAEQVYAAHGYSLDATLAEMGLTRT